MDKVKTFVKDHEKELEMFGLGVMVGSLSVYSSIHMGIKRLFKSIRTFVNE